MRSSSSSAASPAVPLGEVDSLGYGDGGRALCLVRRRLELKVGGIDEARTTTTAAMHGKGPVDLGGGVGGQGGGEGGRRALALEGVSTQQTTARHEGGETTARRDGRLVEEGVVSGGVLLLQILKKINIKGTMNN